MKFEKINIKDIIPAEYNPRKISEEEFQKLQYSIENHGIIDPIIINLKNMHIIGGHQRFDVLVNMNYDEDLNLLKLGDIGWVFTNTDLKVKDSNYEKAMNLSLNKISGEWDEDKLKPLLEDLQLSGLDIELTGFSDFELESLFLEEEIIIPDEEPSFDESIADDVPSITCPKCGYEIPK